MTRHWILSAAIAASVIAFSPAAFADPAAIAPSGSLRQKAEASFKTFAQGWVQDMRQREARASKAGKPHTAPGANWRVELRPTGRAKTPYVGILHYTENKMRCSAANQCQRVGGSGVSEIFRYQNGKWVY